ncbi:hypothetical protein [Schlesneria sp.]|uniref:hypothetical protein n=1 Tax=Schlesneria sp. TaxID=2762018 RepID=UPI002EDEB19F
MRFSQPDASSLNKYLTVTDPVLNQVFDRADNTWKSLGSATNPAFVCAETSLGATSLYHVAIPLATISPNMTPRDIVVTMYTRAGGSPAPLTDTASVQNWALRVCAGQQVPNDPAGVPFEVDVTANLTTTMGTSMHLTAELRRNGVTVPLKTLDPAATCSLVVTQDATASAGARVAQFSMSTGDVGVTNASHRFEAEYASPGLASNRGFTAVATITAGGVTYTGSCKFTTY